MRLQLSKTMFLITAMLLDILGGMEFDLFVPSFPQIAKQFHLSPFAVEGLLSINFLGYFLSLFFVGKLADQYGRKKIVLIGLSIFILGSIFCLSIPSYFFLLLGRFMQGLGIAAPAILGFLIIADRYSLKEQQFWMGILNGITNISVAISPVIGSYVTLYFGWRGNFTALLIFSLAMLMFTFMCIPQEKYSIKEKLLNSEYLPLLKLPFLRLLILCIVLISVPYWIFVGISPILYIRDLGVSLNHFGYYQGALAFIFALGSIGFSFFIKKASQKKLLFLGAKILIFSLMIMVLLSILNLKSPLWITIALIIFVIGQIIPGTLLYPLAINLLPNAKARVTALLQAFRLLLSAIALQATAFVYQGTFQNVGWILSGFIFFGIIILFAVIRHEKLNRGTPD